MVQCWALRPDFLRLMGSQGTAPLLQKYPRRGSVPEELIGIISVKFRLKGRKSGP